MRPIVDDVGDAAHQPQIGFVDERGRLKSVRPGLGAHPPGGERAKLSVQNGNDVAERVAVATPVAGKQGRKAGSPTWHHRVA
jgi:hypothetical protein